MSDEGLFIGSTAEGARQAINWKRANRHGLIAGATGTGKTITLQVMAEGFSRNGVPVFVSDVKGDLSGMAMAGAATQKNHENFANRAKEIGDSEWVYSDNPVQFWDLFGEHGHPHHGFGNGPAYAGTADGPERSAGRRADHRFPRR